MYLALGLIVIVFTVALSLGAVPSEISAGSFRIPFWYPKVQALEERVKQLEKDKAVLQQTNAELQKENNELRADLRVERGIAPHAESARNLQFTLEQERLKKQNADLEAARQLEVSASQAAVARSEQLSQQLQRIAADHKKQNQEVRATARLEGYAEAEISFSEKVKRAEAEQKRLREENFRLRSSFDSAGLAKNPKPQTPRRCIQVGGLDPANAYMLTVRLGEGKTWSEPATLEGTLSSSKLCWKGDAARKPKHVELRHLNGTEPVRAWSISN